VRKLLVCAAALGGFAIPANAADLLAGAKDPIPDALTYKGVTIYGTVDVGYAYQTHGLPQSGAFYELNYGLQTQSDKSVSTLTNNALEQSKIGVKIEEQIGLGFTALAKLETGFNPASGEIADACASILRNNTKSAALGQYEAYSDGSRCGQALNGVAYAGISNPLYGTLTIGRQNALLSDAIGTYDPNKGSYAFSLIGYSGGAFAGAGSTETGRWDNSIRYAYAYGPVHAAVQYTNGGQDTSIFGDGYGANIGATYKGFAIDAYYTKENAAANASILNGSFNQLQGTVTDNEGWAVAGKYTYELGGGFKDEAPSAKVTFFGGYGHFEQSNPEHDQKYYNNYTTIGGYSLFTTTTAGTDAYQSDKVFETAWVGATYETGPWAFTGAYYHLAQDSYKKGNGDPVKSGDTDWGSFVIDYKFNKHFDIYTGVSIAENSGGLLTSKESENVNAVSGIRLKF
jgi:predicted porin